tara:strand:- start:146 stop:427 length:282 start_codon:yes stop_codon:yes gene_type:complete
LDPLVGVPCPQLNELGFFFWVLVEFGATFAAPSGETKSTTLVFFTPVNGAVVLFVLFVFGATSSGEAAGVFVLGNFMGAWVKMIPSDKSGGNF